MTGAGHAKVDAFVDHDVDDFPQDAPLGEKISGEKDADDGKSGGSKGGAHGGVFFDALDEFDNFDKADFQGMPWDDFWKQRRYGAYLNRRITAEGEKFLRLFIEDEELRNKVMDISLSEENKFPTLLMDTGTVIQIQHENNELTRVRATPEIDRDGILVVMGIFQAEGKSIDPRHVRFGRTTEFEARVRPIWEAEFKRMQTKPYADMLRHPKPIYTPARRSPVVG